MGTGIEWTDETWNPVTGCDKISAGCKHCYAEIMANRLQKMGVANYANGFKVTTQPHMLDKPLRWTRPRMIFVNSMSDLFHKDVPLEYIKQVFDVMNKSTHHQFQVLTKRADRLAETHDQLTWGKNIWMGVSVEDDMVKFRIDLLRGISAQNKFLSLEPLIGPVTNMNLDGIHWVIVGGESGPGARKIELDWVRDIREQCSKAAVPFFFKQWGGVKKSETGCELDGEEVKEFPESMVA